MTNTTVYRQHKYDRRADGVLESGTASSRSLLTMNWHETMFSRLTFIDKDKEDCSFLSLKSFSIRFTTSRVYTLKFDSHKFSVYCHMGVFGCGSGGWTPVMKIDGTKVQVFQLTT